MLAKSFSRIGAEGVLRQNVTSTFVRIMASERENESTLTHILRSRGLAEPRATATSALECLHLCPPHRYPTPKHAASTPPNSPQAPRPYQSLDESRFIFTLSEAENLSVHGSFWESLGGFHRVESSTGI